MAEWQEAMSSREFAEWKAFFALQPYGEWRKDYRTASLMALLTNLWRGKDDPVRKPEEFMPRFGPEEEGEHSGSPQLAEDEIGEDAEVEKKMNVAMKLDAYFSALANAGGHAGPPQRT